MKPPPELRLAFGQALETAQGADFFSSLRRGSLETIAASVPELAQPSPTPLTLHLVDPLAKDHTVPAAQAGELLQRLQRAIARIAKARRTHVIDVARLARGDIARAQLDVMAAAPGSLIVEIRPHIDPVRPGELPLGPSTWAGSAMRELLDVLPSGGSDDDEALDLIPLASPVIRRAVNDLVQGGGRLDVDFTLASGERGGEPQRSYLSRSQSQVLRRSLDIASEERVIETRIGRLDGVRTKRKIFYLEVQNGEIHGLVDDDQIEDVKRNLDQQVAVRLEVLITRTRTGRTSHRRYRLLSVENATLQPIFDAIEDDTNGQQ